MKKKSKIWNNLLEALLELILAIFCFVIGCFILKLFNVKVSSIDADVVLLIGCIIFIAIFLLICYLINKIKESKNEKKE